MTPIKFAVSLVKVGNVVELSFVIKIHDQILTDSKGRPQQFAPLHILALTRYYGYVPMLKEPLLSQATPSHKEHAPWSIEQIGAYVHITIPQVAANALGVPLAGSAKGGCCLKVPTEAWHAETSKAERVLYNQVEKYQVNCQVRLWQHTEPVISLSELKTHVLEHVDRLTHLDEGLKLHQHDHPSYLSKGYLGKIKDACLTLA